MSEWRAFKKNSICILNGTNFYLSIALSAILYLTAGIADGRQGESFSAIQLMADYQNCMNALTDPSMTKGIWLISRMLMAEYLSMFLPIVAAFPAIPFFIDERRSGFQRFAISRCDRISYAIAQILSAGIFGGLAVMLGFCVSAGIVLARIPDPSAATGVALDFDMYSQAFSAGAGMRLLRDWAGEPGIYIGFALDTFLYAGFFSLPGAVLACFLNNSYLDMCIPMVFVYLYDTLLKKASSGAMVSGDIQTSDRLTGMLSTSLRQTISMWTVPKMICMISGLVAACALGVWRQYKKIDSGA